MLEAGQKVIYGTHGVCVVVGVEFQTVNRKKTQYYVLEPENGHDARFFVPVQNAVAMAKLHPLLSREALLELLRSDAAWQNTWIPDENQRRQYYRQLLGSGDRAALVSTVRTLLGQREQIVASGRKFHLSDESFLRDAQKLLDAEFSVVLGIDASQVGDYIRAIH